MCDPFDNSARPPNDKRGHQNDIKSGLDNLPPVLTSHPVSKKQQEDLAKLFKAFTNGLQKVSPRE